MRRLLIPLAAVGFLGACEDFATGPAAPLPGSGIGAPGPNAVAASGIPPRQGFLTYLCANGQVVQAQYEDTSESNVMNPVQSGAFVYIDGRGIRMLQGASANGVRYIGGGYQWWTRGLQTANLAPLGPNESTASDPGTECRSNG
jgi:membrane-bound inhibitor of C-type lysozyme